MADFLWLTMAKDRPQKRLTKAQRTVAVNEETREVYVPSAYVGQKGLLCLMFDGCRAVNGHDDLEGEMFIHSDDVAKVHEELYGDGDKARELKSIILRRLDEDATAAPAP